MLVKVLFRRVDTILVAFIQMMEMADVGLGAGSK
jgi:hypothetical protein